MIIFLIDIINIEILVSLKLNIFQSIILTIFCILSFQNAMNMIDGVMTFCNNIYNYKFIHFVSLTRLII